MANEYYKKLFSIFYKDLVVLFTFSFVYIFFEERNYKVKTNVNDQGHEYDILYDHSSIEISFRRSSKDIENLSKYIERKRRNLNKCSFIFIVDDDRLFEECLEIIENYKDTDFVIMDIEKESNVIKKAKISNPNLTRLYEYIKKRFLKIRIDKFVEDEGFLISPLTCTEITEQYRIMFVFAYFIVERFITNFRHRKFDIETFTKEIMKDIKIKNKEKLKEDWKNSISKCIEIFKLNLAGIESAVQEKEKLETIINELYELSLRKEIKKEDIEKLIEKYSEQIKQK